MFSYPKVLVRMLCEHACKHMFMAGHCANVTYLCEGSGGVAVSTAELGSKVSLRGAVCGNVIMENIVNT